MCDLAYLYKRFQKRMESDKHVLFDIKVLSGQFFQSLREVKTQILLGGWDEQLNQRLVQNVESFAVWCGTYCVHSKTDKQRNKFRH
jgi:hypothetical protein